MATTKAARKSTTKKTTARKTTAKSAPAKATTTVRTVSATQKNTPSRAVATATGGTTARKLSNDTVNIVLAELIGTFVLALAALSAVTEIAPLYVGLTLAVLVMTIGAVSGAHVNPAVTFGLWAARKLKTSLLPFYFGAQLLGGMAAVVVLSAVSGSTLGLDFSNFLEFSWSIFMVELIGTAVFLFGLTNVIRRVDLSAGSKALGVGLSLSIGLVVAGSLYAPVPEKAEADYLAKLQELATASQPAEGENPDYSKLREVEVPRAMLVGGATLNPAVALASTENATVEEIHTRYNINDASTPPAEGGSTLSRFTAEVIVATLIGAALGSNLALLVNYRFKD